MPKPGAVDRIFGHTLAFVVWISVIRGHLLLMSDDWSGLVTPLL